MEVAQRSAARPLSLLRSDRKLPGHETLSAGGRSVMATGTCSSQSKVQDVCAAVPEVAAAISSARTNYHQPVWTRPRIRASGYPREEPSARKTHARICEGGVG